MKHPVLRKSPERYDHERFSNGIGSARSRNSRSVSPSPSRTPILATSGKNKDRYSSNGHLHQNPLTVDISKVSKSSNSARTPGRRLNVTPYGPKYARPSSSKKKVYPYAKIGCYTYSYLLDKIEPSLKQMFKVGSKNFKAVYNKLEEQHQEEQHYRSGLINSLAKQEKNLEAINHSHSVQYMQKAKTFVTNLTQKMKLNKNMTQQQSSKTLTLRMRLMARRLDVLKEDIQTH